MNLPSNNEMYIWIWTEIFNESVKTNEWEFQLLCFTHSSLCHNFDVLKLQRLNFFGGEKILENFKYLSVHFSLLD